MTNIIDKPLTHFRTVPARGAKPRVDREKGMYGAGLITGAAAITRGEALGHRAWVDKFAVKSVVELGNRSPKGIKVRFTHPGLSADGMGTLLGRMKNFRVEGDRAIGDIHFARSAHKTPDGDLASYVMDMADEDPEAFGMSIVFDQDRDEQDKFESEHEGEDGHFSSPDDDNSENLGHIRIAKLWASDVVDEPAANPAGLFRKGHAVAEEADKLCEFALGLSSERPTLQHLSVDADRLAQYAARFLDSHNLQLTEKVMSEKNENAPAGVTLEQLNSFGENLLSKVDEKLAALKPEAPKEPTVAEIEARGAERLSQLQSLAHTAGITEYEKTGKEWFDKGLSVEDAKVAIKPLMVGQNPLSNDSGEQPPAGDAKYKKEYAAQRAAFASMSLTEAEYIAGRKIEDGIADAA